MNLLPEIHFVYMMLLLVTSYLIGLVSTQVHKIKTALIFLCKQILSIALTTLCFHFISFKPSFKVVEHNNKKKFTFEKKIFPKLFIST